MTTIPFAQLRLSEPGFQNPRTSSGLDDRSICELALHIGLHGLLNPPLVTERGLVIAGQRRYRAIELLIKWFADQPRTAEEASAQDLTRFSRFFGEDGADLSHEEVSIMERRAQELSRACPVRMVGGSGLEGLALADNIQREQLTSYEIARHLFHLHEQGVTGKDLARLIGKSRTYVSRKLSTWRGACPELRMAWEKSELAEDAVQELAALPHDEQLRALAQPVPRGRRGPANRPGIDTVKDVIDDLEVGMKGRAIQWPVEKTTYANGVIDALRWVSGERASELLAQLVGGGD